MTMTALDGLLELRWLITLLIVPSAVFGVIRTIKTLKLSPDYEEPIYYRRIIYCLVAMAIAIVLPLLIEEFKKYWI